MFFTFHQNNSHGRFDFDEKAGITRIVIIEADSLDEANERAEDIGLYFNGCEDGTDCSHCGDRWSEAWDKEALTEEPEAYGRKVLTEPDTDPLMHLWMGEEGKEICVHYKDGRKAWTD